MGVGDEGQNMGGHVPAAAALHLKMVYFGIWKCEGEACGGQGGIRQGGEEEDDGSGPQGGARCCSVTRDVAKVQRACLTCQCQAAARPAHAAAERGGSGRGEGGGGDGDDADEYGSRHATVNLGEV